MADKLVTIAEFDTPFDAELAKVRLENEGIEAMVVGEDLVANMPTIPIMRVQLQVFEKDVEQAEAILAQVEEDDDESDEDEDFDSDSDDWDDSDDEDTADEDDDFDEDDLG